MKEYKNKFRKKYLLIVVGILGLYGASSYFFKDSLAFLDKWLLIDMIVAVSLILGIFYIGEKPSEKNTRFLEFCEFEATHDREKVDVIHTYIVTIPLFIYIGFIYLNRLSLPRIFKSFSIVALVTILFSFIGYSVCYKNKGFVKENESKKNLI